MASAAAHTSPFRLHPPALVVQSRVIKFSIAVRELRDAEGLNEAWLQARLIARAGAVYLLVSVSVVCACVCALVCMCLTSVCSRVLCPPV